MRVSVGKEDKLPPTSVTTRRDMQYTASDKTGERYSREYDKQASETYTNDWTSDRGEARVLLTAEDIGVVDHEETETAADPAGGVYVSSIPVRNSAIHEIRETSAYFELDGQGFAFGGALAGASYELNTGSLPEQAVHDAFSYGWSIYFKDYLNEGRVFVSPYYLIGFGEGTFRWSYDQPVLTASGYSIYSDALDYADFRFGLGAELARSYGVSLTLTATALWRIYGSVTREGFDNDIFSSHFSPAYGTSLTMRF